MKSAGRASSAPLARPCCTIQQFPPYLFLSSILVQTKKINKTFSLPEWKSCLLGDLGDFGASSLRTDTTSGVFSRQWSHFLVYVFLVFRLFALFWSFHTNQRSTQFKVKMDIFVPMLNIVLSIRTLLWCFHSSCAKSTNPALKIQNFNTFIGGGRWGSVKFLSVNIQHEWLTRVYLHSTDSPFFSELCSSEQAALYFNYLPRVATAPPSLYFHFNLSRQVRDWMRRRAEAALLQTRSLSELAVWDSARCPFCF